MNPEFQRNLWLDASPRRAIWAGVTVLLVYFAAACSTALGVSASVTERERAA